MSEESRGSGVRCGSPSFDSQPGVQSDGTAFTLVIYLCICPFAFGFLPDPEGFRCPFFRSLCRLAFPLPSLRAGVGTWQVRALSSSPWKSRVLRKDVVSPALSLLPCPLEPCEGSGRLVLGVGSPRVTVALAVSPSADAFPRIVPLRPMEAMPGQAAPHLQCPLYRPDSSSFAASLRELEKVTTTWRGGGGSQEEKTAGLGSAFGD